MSFIPQNVNGQATMANSAPVVIASNQSSIPVAATLTAETTKVIGTVNVAAGTNNIGDVDVLTLPALATGSNVIGALVANQSINNSQIGGVAVSTGNGVVGTGVQRVAIASDNSPVPVTKPSQLFKGRAQTFRTPGRAGTAGQNIMSIHNATGSTISLQLNKITVDLVQTVIKAVTVLPPIIRMWKVTVLPTNGTSLVKTKIGGSTTSNASVTVLGDASADGTGSGTTLTATRPAGTFISQEFAPRLITAAGYEMSDRLEFFGDTEVVLGALEGIVVFLDYTLATQNPTTDMWIAGIEWEEKTP